MPVMYKVLRLHVECRNKFDLLESSSNRFIRSLEKKSRIRQESCRLEANGKLLHAHFIGLSEILYLLRLVTPVTDICLVRREPGEPAYKFTKKAVL
ncbi:hypothetical protein I308_101396 [Cryptococcus tetragattii IND107]|uniref:Uncharacterized protein n=1 Tax=Cryptococcus tetragattii IND107 TaxID=1296105 RepID=A0ABR3C0A7_9TREE